MSSGFSSGYPELCTADGSNGRAMMTTNNTQDPYRSPLAGILPDPSSQIFQRQADLTGKRSLAEFQQQFQQQQLALYLRNVKQRAKYQQQASPISPLSPPVDFSGNSLSPDVSSISSSSSSSISTRYGLPMLQLLRQQQHMISNNGNHLSGFPFPNLVQNRAVESEKNMMNRLQELEKQLLDDNDEEQGDGGSVIINSEWSETIQSLNAPIHNPISPSPTSSSSSCSSSSASPLIINSAKQSLTEAASAISEGKFDAAVDALTRLGKLSNTRGTSEQRLTAYMASALRSRVNPTEYPPPVAELYGKDHMLCIQMLYEVSPCFKLGFMAANLAILEAISNENNVKLHVIDFDIGQGGQYVHLLHAMAAKKTDYKIISLKITTFLDYSANCDEARLKVVGDGLNALAGKVGVGFCFKIMSLNISELNSSRIGVEPDEVLAVNFAFRLYKFPDESVTTENLRDEMLRRVKGMSPMVVTVVEQEMNANTAPLVARVTEACGYYVALFESLDATVPRDKPERVRIEEALSRKMANSVACEGKDRVERCEVFGKWRARMGMAGFEAKRLSQQVADSLRGKLNSGTRGNPGFTVKEESGGICFGWMGRSLTVASAWR